MTISISLLFVLHSAHAMSTMDVMAEAGSVSADIHAVTDVSGPNPYEIEHSGTQRRTVSGRVLDGPLSRRVDALNSEDRRWTETDKSAPDVLANRPLEGDVYPIDKGVVVRGGRMAPLINSPVWLREGSLIVDVHSPRSRFGTEVPPRRRSPMFFIIYTLSMLCSLFIAAVGDVFASCKTAGVTVGEKGLQVALPRLSRSA